MKTLFLKIPLLIFSFLFFNGCYTRLVVNEDKYEYDDEEYSYEKEDQDDSDTINKNGTTIINNYYGDDYYRYSRYKYSFRFYYPRRYSHWSDWYFYDYDDCWYPCDRPWVSNYYGWNNYWWRNPYYPYYYNPYYSYYDPFYNPYYWGNYYGSGNLNNAVFRTRTGSGETRGEDNSRTRFTGSNPSPTIGSGTGTIIGVNPPTITTPENKPRKRDPWWEKIESNTSTETKKRIIIDEDKPSKKEKNNDAVRMPEKIREEKQKPRERTTPEVKQSKPTQSNPPSENRTRTNDEPNNSSTRKRDK